MRVAAGVAEAGDDAICASTIVAANLRFGAVKKGFERPTVQLERILAAIDSQPFEAPATSAMGGGEPRSRRPAHPSAATTC